ncbi:EpsG family protein [Chryseobacterium oryzae]|uniref:EpsG family protein n=1 Tax=Chryseobacterium oryzae TaxID=2929799 RepID=A0ABY4BH59_9FLAO|nr:EpsG family protein [Chryseobacterium oryzae]UOE38511.1 EpsG family protein [Chryseobacterium oryzae]
MSLLHPYYLIVIAVLLFFSVQEVFGRRVDRKYQWYLAIFLILIAGLRKQVGPDYGSYVGIYAFSGQIDYVSILFKAFYLDPPTPFELEWLFILINKVMLNIFNAPFYMFTLVIAAITVFFKMEYIDDNTFYPFTFILFMFIPGFFIGESGQIRQCLGSFIAYYAIRFIKSRQLFLYILFILIGAGIHNVCYVFLPMYWIARIPMNKLVMLGAFITCIFLSPFEVYRVFGNFLDSIASDNMLVEGFNGYVEESVTRLNGGFGIPEGMMAILTFFLFFFDTPMKEKFPYYEYHRNYAVIGICAYFIFRNNPIFSSRLAGAFIGFSYIIIVNSMYVVNDNTKRLIYTFIITLFIFNFVVFSTFKNIVNGNFTIERYQNYLLP